MYLINTQKILEGEKWKYNNPAFTTHKSSNRSEHRHLWQYKAPYFFFFFPPPNHHTIHYHGKMGMGFIPSGGYTSVGVFHYFGHLIPFVILKPCVEDTPARPGCTPGTLPALQLLKEASKFFPSEEWILLSPQLVLQS